MPEKDGWWDDRGCREVDPDIFSPNWMKRTLDGRGSGLHGIRTNWNEAKVACWACPVREQCLNHVMSIDPGIEGDLLFAAGFTPEELSTIRARRNRSKVRAR